jgi:hypothetical protein
MMGQQRRTESLFYYFRLEEQRQRLRLANLDDGPVPHQRQGGCLVRQRSGKNEVVVTVYQDAYHMPSSLQARVRNRVTDCEMVDNLS